MDHLRVDSSSALASLLAIEAAHAAVAAVVAVEVARVLASDAACPLLRGKLRNTYHIAPAPFVITNMMVRPGGPVQVIYPSGEIFGRSVFPLVWVELYLDYR